MEIVRVWCIAAALVLSLVVLVSAESVRPVWKDHPYLFVERSEVHGILERAKREEWAKDALDGLRNSADRWLNRELEFPPSTGRHSATYICPDCKEVLKTLAPTRHQCPRCGKIYSGLPYDARLYCSQHSELGAAAAHLGLASLLFDDQRYARKALDILLGYADRYDAYPLLDIRGGQAPSAAKVFDQTLNEAIWLIDIAWAYDLVLGAGVGSADEHSKVEEKLLRPSIQTVRRYRAGKSNWQTWHNAGLLAAALVLKDEKLVDEVLNDPSNGVYFQMANSIMPDGAWFEGSWSYHSYSVSALLKTAEAARRSGIDLYTPELKKALLVPLKCIMPNGKLPALNDGAESTPGGWHYEVAAARYDEPLFEGVVARSKRGGLEALLIGIEEPRRHTSALKSEIFEASGLAILRRGDQFVSLDFGPHGGGHGHLDKLSVNYFTLGRTFAPDPGRGWPYNLPIHREWYKMTLSHNTVVVDETPQKESQGTLESHDFSGDYHIVTARAEDCYDGVLMKRTVALSSTWLLDVFDVESDQEHIYDWVWHGRGDFSSALPVAAWKCTSEQASYKYLTNTRKGDGSRDWQAMWKWESGSVYGLFKGSPDREVILCDAPDNPATNTLHSILLRDKARKTRFVSLFSTKPMKWSDLPDAVRSLID